MISAVLKTCRFVLEEIDVFLYFFYAKFKFEFKLLVFRFVKHTLIMKISLAAHAY